MNEKNFNFHKRVMIIGVFITLFFCVLVLKLFFIQIRSEEDYDKKILRQSIRKIRIPSLRGRIYTSDLKILADIKPNAQLLLYINEIRLNNRTKTIDLVEKQVASMALKLNREYNLTREKIARHIKISPALPMVIFTELTTKEIAIISSKIDNTGGWAIETISKRDYPHNNMAAHLIGYAKKEEDRNALDRKDYSYYVADLVGKTGVEKAFDVMKGDNPALCGLRGLPGYSIKQVDNLGYVRRTIIKEIAPKHGNHLILNLDFKAQQIAENLLKDLNGAFVLLDANNGKLLASVSKPNYNLKEFVPILKASYYKTLLNDVNRPLVDKAIYGSLTPGSIVKPLVALAILKNPKLAETKVLCDGFSKIGNATIRCTSYRYGGHGPMDLVTALEKSCNDYFIEKGLLLEREKIYDAFVSANLGQSPQIEIPASNGILPTPINKQRQYRTRWNNFDTSLISIGQGIISCSPLQAAMFTAAIANGGNVYRPQIINRVVDQEGNTLYQPKIKVLSKLDATSKALEHIKEGMFQVVNAYQGSGRNAKIKGVRVYGKTGTAEVGSKANRTQNTWFIAFLTYQKRTYAACMLILNGKSGGATCAPLMKKFFEDYLKI